MIFSNKKALRFLRAFLLEKSAPSFMGGAEKIIREKIRAPKF
jgi:hypothetical protein